MEFRRPAQHCTARQVHRAYQRSAAGCSGYLASNKSGACTTAAAATTTTTTTTTRRDDAN